MNSTYARIPALMALFLLVAAIPVSVYLVQQQQIFENRAAERAQVGEQAMPPKVDIASPANNSKVADGDQVTVAITNAVTVSGVEFYVDGKQVSTLSQPPFIFTLPALASGTHSIMVRAYDDESRVSTKTISVTK